MASAKLTMRQIYRVPALLAAISFIGLVSALIGDGIYDMLSWAALALPLIAIGRFLLRASR